MPFVDKGFYHISEKIATMWHKNDIKALTRNGSRGVGAQPPLCCCLAHLWILNFKCSACAFRV